MPFEKFESWNPREKSLIIVEHCNNILNEYEAMGYKLTLRQLYYQLVSQDIIPNNIKQYNSLGNVVSKARLSGLMNWSMIEDRVRIPKERTHWHSPEQILRAAASGFYRNRWNNQDHYVEVWSEKDAVSNIIEPVCKEYDVLYLANRGYSSQSAMYEAYKRIDHQRNQGKECHVIYVGDHDPSGIDMSRDITDRLSTFTGQYFNKNKRVALNMSQVEEYNPPVNPAKMTDSRFNDYVSKYGYDCWELDALKPDVLSKIIEDAILQYADLDEFARIEAMDEDSIEKLNEIADKGIE